jgi:hypothetical protein
VQHQYCNFGHFVSLLHIEFLEELTSLERRFSKDAQSLERSGWMGRNLVAVEVIRADRGCAGSVVKPLNSPVRFCVGLAWLVAGSR